MKVHWSRFERYGIDSMGEAKEVHAAACGAGEDLMMTDGEYHVTCKRCQAVIRRLKRMSLDGGTP